MNLDRFFSVGVITLQHQNDPKTLEWFRQQIEQIKQKDHWNREEIIQVFNTMLPEFRHKETGQNLDNKM